MLIYVHICLQMATWMYFLLALHSLVAVDYISYVSLCVCVCAYVRVCANVSCVTRVLCTHHTAKNVTRSVAFRRNKFIKIKISLYIPACYPLKGSSQDKA